MDSLTGAIIAAAVAWASIVLAAFLPIPQAAFLRLRWVGAASIALVAFALVGVAVPNGLPVVVLLVGGAVALLWPPHRTARGRTDRGVPRIVGKA